MHTFSKTTARSPKQRIGEKRTPPQSFRNLYLPPNMSRQATLEKELEQLNDLNIMADQLLDTIKKTQRNITSSKSATDNTSALLENWIKILNQSKFVGDVLEDPSWTGAVDVESSQGLDTEVARLNAELQALEKENSAIQRRLDSSSLPINKRVRR